MFQGREVVSYIYYDSSFLLFILMEVLNKPNMKTLKKLNEKQIQH